MIWWVFFSFEMEESLLLHRKLHRSPQEESYRTYLLFNYLLFNTPKISKMMSSNIVQENAKVTEKITCTTY